jgi:hypothetical protein
VDTTITTALPIGEPTVDGDRLMAFVFRAVGEIGALVVMGDRLGYYALWPVPARRRLPSWPNVLPPTRTAPVSCSTPCWVPELGHGV